MFKSFFEKCLCLSEKPENVDDYVHMWHSGVEPKKTLREFLGFDKELYQIWLHNPSAVEQLILKLQEEIHANRNHKHSESL